MKVIRCFTGQHTLLDLGTWVVMDVEIVSSLKKDSSAVIKGAILIFVSHVGKSKKNVLKMT